MNKTIRRIMRYANPYRKYLLLTVVLSFIGVSLSLLVPIFIGKAVDLAVPLTVPLSTNTRIDLAAILQVVIELSVVVVVSALFQWLQGLCINRLTFGTVKDLRSDLEAKLQTMPISYIDGNARGDLIARVVPDIEILSDGLLQGFAQLFSGLVTIVGTLAFMLTINIKIALLVVVLTPLSFVVAAQITKASHNAFVWQSELRGELSGLTEELVGGVNVVKAFAYEDRAIGRFEEINRKLGAAGQKATFFSSMSNPSTRFVNGLIYAAVGTFGALGAIGAMPWIGVMSVGNLASFLAYANQYTKPFNEISGVVTELQNALACAGRLFALIEAEPQSPEPADAAALTDVRGSITARDVSFSYTPDRKLIEHLELDIKPGQKVAIVGPTGCGKTTFINLLMRFYDVTGGSISVDGRDIREVTRNSLRGSFGMVLQDTILISGTIRDNIRMGKPDATDEEIIAAAKAAHAHSFIKRLPDRYDTVIGEDGGSLSQGQKQLLCISRIMLCLPPMLILDEATSSIDTRTELKIQDAFTTLMKGRTSFIVAHRLSTIRDADIILVMNNGSIIEQGRHEELLAKNGFYARLYNSQFAD
ncbi:MAG: ABC transporter ATP-binding protein/permease [Ruminiclostridium sp.]|nr:ABC transporter ATP-binding protein/permease [Ruminiclostridium sp.]